jgi:hypothetical protein
MFKVNSSCLPPVAKMSRKILYVAKMFEISPSQNKNCSAVCQFNKKKLKVQSTRRFYMNFFENFKVDVFRLTD